MKRIETRYKTKDNNVAEYLKANFKQLRFSENEYTETVYLDTNPPSLPKNLKVKARRYLKEADDSTSSNLDNRYLFEFKQEEDSKVYKKRSNKLEELLNDIKEITFVDKIGGYTMTTYLRKHFVKESIKDFRVTFDSDIKYYLISPSKQIVSIGAEDFYRIEFKYKELSPAVSIITQNIVNNYKLQEVISKRDVSYDLAKIFKFLG